MKVLEVSKISKRFGNFKAVEDVSFSIEEGVIFGLLGPNGAGKTTSIRMIMNIILPDSGGVSVLGETNSRTANDFIGYLPEERGLYRKMKVAELLLFMAALKRTNKRKARQAVDYWLDKIDLMDWKNKKIEELSKGMQQKIQFIGTVLHEPKLLILDEPFGGLDPINQNLIKDILLTLDALIICFVLAAVIISGDRLRIKRRREVILREASHFSSGKRPARDYFRDSKPDGESKQITETDS